MAKLNFDKESCPKVMLFITNIEQDKMIRIFNIDFIYCKDKKSLVKTLQFEIIIKVTSLCPPQGGKPSSTFLIEYADAFEVLIFHFISNSKYFAV